MTEANTVTIIIGAGGGIGAALVSKIATCEPHSKIHALARQLPTKSTPQLIPGIIDIADEQAIRKAASAIDGPVDRIVVATGILHEMGYGPERALRTGCLLQAGLLGDRDRFKQAAIAAGILTDAVVARHGTTIDRMLHVILQEIGRPGAFDFGDRAFVGTLRDDGSQIASDRSSWHVPPADILFAQRKISGTALLAARLRARVDVRSLIASLG